MPVNTTPLTTKVEVNQTEVRIITVGIQGPPGPSGSSGSGNVVASETPPVTPDVGQQWFKPSTRKTSVWSGTEWINYINEDELASATGSLDANGGYF